MKHPKRKEMQTPLKFGNLVWLLKNFMQQGIWPIERVLYKEPIGGTFGKNGLLSRVVTVRMAPARSTAQPPLLLCYGFFDFLWLRFFAPFSFGAPRVYCRNNYFFPNLCILKVTEIKHF